MNVPDIPTATYRLQFNYRFTLKNAAGLAPFFNDLGISHIYSSPLLKAGKESLHGYDVVDHKSLNPEIGSQDDFQAFIKCLQSQNLGLILDIVPNHTFIGDCQNKWWVDLLQNGKESPYADFFDIDWQPTKAIFSNKIYLPLLEEAFATALENKKIQVSFENNAFTIQVSNLSLPTDPKSWTLIWTPLLAEVQKFEKGSLFRRKLEDLLESNSYGNLTKLFQEFPKIFEMLTQQLNALNGIKGVADSFDFLEQFLNAQHYRLCYWRVANEEINYRRFFDILHYAAIRVENPKVFEEAHQLIFEWVNHNQVQGLRIDHIDGLWDPKQYLETLRKKENLYLIAEKILTGNEPLRKDWPIQGTVGYDTLNLLNSIFVYSNHKAFLIDLYKAFSGTDGETPSAIKHTCKRLILNTSLASELNLLARRLYRLAERHRSSQDFSQESLKSALLDIIVFFPVYRSYIRAPNNEVHEEDRRCILGAIARAKRYNRSVDHSIYEFIQNLLLLHPLSQEEEYKKACAAFVMHFQQITGPVMAKGLEDTAFYRYYPLASINEVGGEIDSFGINLENFHKKNLERLEFWPHTLCSTTTHDTKRSEDVRARINVISEIPQAWKKIIEEWRSLNQAYKTEIEGNLVPDGNEEYLLYQTLIGTWPLLPMNELELKTYIERIQNYLEKAIKEAKVHQSWVDPSNAYTDAVKNFIQNILSFQPFVNNLSIFAKAIQEFGMLNSLVQVLFKLTIPGIPDIYQGNELWRFNLVDPDNRQVVDYGEIENALETIKNHLTPLQECLKNPRDGKIKLFLTKKILNYRKQKPQLFSTGIYMPLAVKGPKQEHCIAFARIHEKNMAIIIAGRFFSFFMQDFTNTLHEDFWAETFLELPLELTNIPFKDLFTDKPYNFVGQQVPMQTLFESMPFLLLRPCSISNPTLKSFQ